VAIAVPRRAVDRERSDPADPIRLPVLRFEYALRLLTLLLNAAYAVVELEQVPGERRLGKSDGKTPVRAAHGIDTWPPSQVVGMAGRPAAGKMLIDQEAQAPARASGSNRPSS
jgi:hypothetical protein